jgi:hypothetical protein
VLDHFVSLCHRDASGGYCLGIRQSNLDPNLLSVLKNTTNVATLVPADNAGLGLARAVSVVSVLRQSPLIAGYKLIPLSDAQLVNTDETLAMLGNTWRYPPTATHRNPPAQVSAREAGTEVARLPFVAPPKRRVVKAKASPASERFGRLERGSARGGVDS